MSLLSTPEFRRANGLVSATLLLQRAKLAASAELSGERFSSEDREDCAADILARALTDLTPNVDRERSPRAWENQAIRSDDRRVSFARLCGLAKNYRRSLLSERTRQAGREVEAADALSLAPLSDFAEVRHDGGGGTGKLVQDIERATELLDRLDLPSNNATEALAWTFARDIPNAEPRLCLELGCTPHAYRKRMSRAREAIRAQYPDPTDLIKALVGSPSWLPDPEQPSTPILTFAAEGSTPQGVRRADRCHRTHSLAPDDRTGTDGGNWPERPTTKTAARQLCRWLVDDDAIAPTGIDRHDRQAIAESRRRLGRALALAR